MYYNVFGEKVSRARYREMQNAAKNRRELIAGGCFTRRDLMKLGLITGAGMLVAKSGLSARAGSFLPQMQAASPHVTPFVDPMPFMPIKQTVPSLSPAPTVCPNTAAGEGRVDCHQALTLLPPQKFYTVHQKAAQVFVSSSLPTQTLWTFDGISPGPLYVARYGEPILVRNFNDLPPVSQNGGFGLPSVTTHLHNGHTPSESDGFFADFFEIGHWYDQHYPNVLAGFQSTHPPNGDINESMSTLWYHDHRVGFTAQNTYKGLVGNYLLFNQFDTGNEQTGFHLPSFPQFDIPMIFADRVFDANGILSFDLFNIDGILGDVFLVNGVAQPFLRVQPRKYRFRLTNTGPSRFYSFFLTNPQDLGAHNLYRIIANDGNLLPRPIQVESVTIGVAERVDVIIDFSQVAGQTFFLENRLQQLLGRGPADPPVILPAGQGTSVLKIIVSGDQQALAVRAADRSGDPSMMTFYPLPDNTAPPRVTRSFEFDRLNGQWSINGRFVDPEETRFTVQQNDVEHWILNNLSGDWQHPVHIHLEEHQILTRNRVPPPNFEVSRKDVTRLHQNERIELFFRFRDWTGEYPIHCHNVVHEDTAMMMRWEIQPQGDLNRNP